MQTLIADISHQTKTPIANILLYASLLAEGELSPEQAGAGGQALSPRRRRSCPF